MIRRLAIRAARFIVWLAHQPLTNDGPAFAFDSNPDAGIWRSSGTIKTT